MGKITINGVDLEIDLLDADTAERAESAIARVATRSEEIKADKEIGLAAGIRATCQEIFSCFNAIFGEGTDKQIFEDRTNLGECMTAFGELTSQAFGQARNALQGLNARYLPNREARRATRK